MAMPSGESLRQSSSAKCVAAGSEERLAAADAELLQRLEAIGGKARRGDGDALHALGRDKRPASRRSPARAISRGRTATGRRRRPRGRAPRRAAARSSGNGSDRDRRARSVRCGMPWKLSSSRSRLEIERLELAREVGAQRLDVERIVIIRRQRAQRRLDAHRAPARRTPRRWRSPSSPRNIADRAARRGCACSRPPSCARSPRRCPGLP